MLNALLSGTRAVERIVTVEETFELDLSAREAVSMQCRQPSLEGTGEVGLRRLIKEALRMRPDRLIVGEVREAEALDLLIALNSGLPKHYAMWESQTGLRKCLGGLASGRDLVGDKVEFARHSSAGNLSDKFESTGRYRQLSCVGIRRPVAQVVMFDHFS
jgi:pilus assembly protein CpaF